MGMRYAHRSATSSVAARASPSQRSDEPADDVGGGPVGRATVPGARPEVETLGVARTGSRTPDRPGEVVDLRVTDRRMSVVPVDKGVAQRAGRASREGPRPRGA